MNVYFMLGMPSDMDSSVTNQLCDNESMDITLCVDCVDGNRWFAFHSDISIRPMKGDYIQVSDCVRFVINKVIIHLDESDNGENFITVECMYDDSYE